MFELYVLQKRALGTVFALAVALWADEVPIDLAGCSPVPFSLFLLLFL
jgi:hypothetical protein